MAVVLGDTRPLDTQIYCHKVLHISGPCPFFKRNPLWRGLGSADWRGGRSICPAVSPSIPGGGAERTCCGGSVCFLLPVEDRGQQVKNQSFLLPHWPMMERQTQRPGGRAPRAGGSRPLWEKDSLSAKRAPHSAGYQNAKQRWKRLSSPVDLPRRWRHDSQRVLGRTGPADSLITTP